MSELGEITRQIKELEFQKENLILDIYRDFLGSNSKDGLNPSDELILQWIREENNDLQEWATNNNMFGFPGIAMLDAVEAIVKQLESDS